MRARPARVAASACSHRTGRIAAGTASGRKPPGRDRGARISGMDALAPIPHSGSRDADGLRAAELEHAVQGMDGHGDLGGLMTVRARAEPVSNHPLVAGDRYLGQSATIVS